MIKNIFKLNFAAIMVVCLCSFGAFAQPTDSDADRGDGDDSGIAVYPKEAYTVCKDAPVAQKCTFKRKGRKLDGTCRALPNDKNELRCEPNENIPEGERQ